MKQLKRVNRLIDLREHARSIDTPQEHVDAINRSKIWDTMLEFAKSRHNRATLSE